jgi:Type II secretion system (T2SS), protein E, N-terminal domain
MRKEIIETLCRSATAEEAAVARSCARGKGNIVADLIEAGLHRRQVLAACSEVTGIPRAPSAWFKEQTEVPLDGIDPEQCARHLFVPIAVEAGELCIAYGDPAVAVAREDLELPPHQPYLATPTKVARAVKRLLTRAERDSTEQQLRAASSAGESSAFSNKRRKKKRNERRAASTEGAALDDAPPSRGAQSRQRAWEPTEELPRSPAEPPAQHAEQSVPPRPPPPRPSNLRLSSFSVGGADAGRSHGPLDPPMPATGVIDPPMPSPQQRARPPQQGASRAAPPKPREPERKKPARPKPAPTSTSSGRTALVALMMVATGVGLVAFARTTRRGRPVVGTEPVVVVEDGKVDLTSRQRALIRRAQSEVSGVEAVNHLTSAINLDPSSEAGRDAFLARARLYLAGGELERARRDLQRIARRADAAALREEIDGLLADIEKRIGPASDAAPGARAGPSDAGPASGAADTRSP